MSTPLFDLSGRIAIITGGAGLLASEHALALSEFGATIVLADFNEENVKPLLMNYRSSR